MAPIPETCPHCGAGREHFVADYYEAVRQGIVIEDDGESYDYDGVYDSYDDGSTSDECIRCTECWTEVEVFGAFQLIPLEVVALMQEALVTDDGHHKQWYLAEIARKLNITIPDGIEVGIAP